MIPLRCHFRCDCGQDLGGDTGSIVRCTLCPLRHELQPAYRVVMRLFDGGATRLPTRFFWSTIRIFWFSRGGFDRVLSSSRDHGPKRPPPTSIPSGGRVVLT